MRLRYSTRLLAISLLVALVCLTPAAYSQTPEQIRQKAIDLFDENKFVAALPLLEKAAAAEPKDPVIASRLGYVLYALGGTSKDPKIRSEYWERARKILLESKANGDHSNLTMLALEALAKEDPIPNVPFSDKKAAEEAIRKGEDEFVRGNIQQALELYIKALELDPRLYEAALYAGDMEFRLAFASKDPDFREEHFRQAGIWFAKAITINPNRETAYRYWGDALDQEGKTEAARDRFVEAIIAEPYSGNRAYVGLTQWADRHRVAMGHPKIEVPSKITSKKPGETTVTLDESALKDDSDGSAAWLMYGLMRVGWQDTKEGRTSEKFRKAYPAESIYRHSLAEEVDAFRAVLESVRVQLKERTATNLSPSLQKLMKLDQAGLLEPFILFARADEGIVQDYVAYRKANREKLKEYWLKIVIGVQ